MRADWPAPFNVTIGNPRADKLGRDGFELNVSGGVVKLIGKDVFAQRLCSAISRITVGLCFTYNDGWSIEGIKRSGTKSLFMIISHYCQSCMCRQ